MDQEGTVRPAQAHRVYQGALSGLCDDCELQGKCGILTMTDEAQLTPLVSIATCSVYRKRRR